MSGSAENADVIQGRLGWEADDVSKAKVEELSPHPKNVEIYGDTAALDDTFVESIREKGVLEPLVITQGKKIISGHRRHQAAQKTNIESIPVRYAEFDSDLTEREALIEFNRQREKTPGQIVNEFEEILEIEKERASKRQTATLKEGDEEPDKETFPERESGQARDKAAEKVNANVSGRTLEKGLDVKKKAEGGDETAQDEWEKLQKGDTTFHPAQEAVNEATEATEEPDSDENDIEQFTSQETDEWSSPRELVEPVSEALGGFDLDAASGAESSPFAESVYTEADDGLKQDWFGSVWCNPPYSDMSAWTDKAISESNRNDVETVVYLCKGDTSTDWWQAAAHECTLITAIDHRLAFGDGENSAPFASHLLVFGDIPRGLLSPLREQGIVLTVGWDDE